MDFAIALPTPADSWKAVARAEQLGFAAAWFYDTQLLSADLFVGMAAAAMKTSRIRLGTGVLIPSNRIAPVAANALASLNALAPGRIDFGVGTGFTGRMTMGLGAMRLADMAEYIRIVYGLLGRETVTWEFEAKARKIRFLNPDLGLINTEDPIPLHISAFGPKSRRLTASLGAGWLNFYRDLLTATRGIEDMQAAWGEAGRERDDLECTVFALGCVLAEGEAYDGDRAMAQAGPVAAVNLHRSIEGGIDIDHLPAETQDLFRGFRELYESYEPEDARYLSLHRGHLMFVREDEKPYVTAELIRSRTLIGTVNELRDTIRQLEEIGYRQLAVQLVPGHEMAALDDWARVFDGL
ncbi:MAG: LLM class flavin-dependent oxidoreductase [Alphaproteobacteria bacterium]|nr:LLM class flavin-dependent oxidoreductase [Alphaproteobacteria bacterium]